MQNFIDGKWEPAVGGETMPVVNPATGEAFEAVPRSDRVDANIAIQSAQAAFETWRNVPMAERARLQHAAAAAMRERADEFGRVLTQELGRPFSAAKREIVRSAELLDYYAEEGLRLRGEMPLMGEPNERVFVTKQPLGVVIAITPFNYPITLLTFKLGAALITGCTLVCKPAEDTPLTTLMLANLFHEVGYPAGAFNVVTGYGHEVGKALVEHPVPRKVAFTGSTQTGQAIAALAMATSKRVTLEMGGQSPAIVAADADLDKAIPQIVGHAYSNTGQFCYRVNRIYVERPFYADFITRFVAGAEKLVVGDGMMPNCQLGPLVNEKIYANSERQVVDALAKGARLATGGRRLTGGDYDKGHYFPPTVLIDTDHSMEIMTEETFGPVVGIMPFDEWGEAVRLADDSRYGLAAYVFTSDVGMGLKTAEMLEAGSVWVNNIRRSYHHVPFGGMKQSGIGREKSRHALDEYLELKTIYLGFE